MYSETLQVRPIYLNTNKSLQARTSFKFENLFTENLLLNIQ